MPLFFFHLMRGDDISLDEIGNEFPSAEAAFLAAYDTALEMSFEMLKQSKDPLHCRFEIADASRAILFDLPFGEALRTAHPRTRSGELSASLRRAEGRARQLKSELGAEYARARSLLDSTRELVAKLRALGE